MAFTSEFKQSYLNAIIAWPPHMEFSVEIVVVTCYLCRCRASVVVYPHIQSWFCTAEITCTIVRTMNMQDWYRAYICICRCATHRIPAYRSKGCNKVRNLIHSMICEHTTHGETAEINTITVYLILCHHLFDDSLNEINVTIARSIPCPVNAIRKDHDELGCITNSLHTYLVVLELGILHPVGILIVAVAEDKQRTVLAKICWRIHIVRTVSTVNCYVVCLHWQNISHK